MHKRNPLKIIIQLKVLNLLFTESFSLSRTLSRRSPLCHQTEQQLLQLLPSKSLSHVQLSATPRTAARQIPLPSTISWSLLKLMSIDLVMPSNHLILCHHFLLLPSISCSIRVFSGELVLRIRWPSIEVSASASVLPINTQD